MVPPDPFKPLGNALGTAYAATLSPSDPAGLILSRAGTRIPCLGWALSTSDAGI